jgi:TPR repeat protein
MKQRNAAVLFVLNVLVGSLLVHAAGPATIDDATLQKLRKRAKDHDRDVQLFLAEAFTFALGVKVDLVQARYWAAEAASAQAPRGMVLQAQLMNQGLGGPKDLVAAGRLARNAAPLIKAQAEAGDAMSQALWAWLLSEGIGIDRDDAMAFSWAAKSAKSGSAVGQNLLGNFYAGGQGVEKDQAEALLWYRAAADQNIPQAQHNIGRILAFAPKFKDPEEALKWWTRSAEQNHPGAQTALGIALQEGIGTAQDLVSAAAWFAVAKLEDPDAARRYGQVLSKLSAEDRVKLTEKLVTLRKNLSENR